MFGVIVRPTCVIRSSAPLEVALDRVVAGFTSYRFRVRERDATSADLAVGSFFTSMLSNGLCLWATPFLRHWHFAGSIRLDAVAAGESLVRVMTQHLDTSSRFALPLLDDAADRGVLMLEEAGWRAARGAYEDARLVMFPPPDAEQAPPSA